MRITNKIAIKRITRKVKKQMQKRTKLQVPVQIAVTIQKMNGVMLKRCRGT